MEEFIPTFVVLALGLVALGLMRLIGYFLNQRDKMKKLKEGSWVEPGEVVPKSWPSRTVYSPQGRIHKPVQQSVRNATVHDDGYEVSDTVGLLATQAVLDIIEEDASQPAQMQDDPPPEQQVEQPVFEGGESEGAGASSSWDPDPVSDAVDSTPDTSSDSPSDGD